MQILKLFEGQVYTDANDKHYIIIKDQLFEYKRGNWEWSSMLVNEFLDLDLFEQKENIYEE